MKRPDIPALLAGSMDVKYERFNAGLMLLLPAPFLICLVPAVMMDMLLPTAALIGILLAVALPFAVHYWNRANRLLRDPERYRLCTAVPVKMEANFFWHMIKLELEIYDGDRVVPGETGYIFTSSVMSSRYFGDYFGQQLQILWDEAGGRVVVLGKQ